MVLAVNFHALSNTEFHEKDGAGGASVGADEAGSGE